MKKTGVLCIFYLFCFCIANAEAKKEKVVVIKNQTVKKIVQQDPLPDFLQGTGAVEMIPEEMGKVRANITDERISPLDEAVKNMLK